MQLRSFRISKYRNINDSGDIDIKDSLTCIVGKNQSGKTSLLKALHKFNPHDPAQSYNMNRDWPRGQRRERDQHHVVCAVTFSLDEDERSDLLELTSVEGELKTVRVTKTYAGNYEVEFPDNPELFPAKLHPTTVEEICTTNIPAIPEPVGEEFKKAAQQCLRDVKRLAKEGRYTEIKTVEADHLAALQGKRTPGNPQPQHGHETQFESGYAQALKKIVAELDNLPTMQAAAHDYVISRLPTFIYMDEYRTFRGRALLNQLRDRKNSKQLTEEDETVLMLLNLAGLDLDRLIEQGQSGDQDVIDERQQDLQDGGLTLTREVAGRWGQSPYRIEFRLDNQSFLTNIEQTSRNVGMLPLEEQSAGFRWFFSFDLHFMHDSNGSFSGCVLLLDEPGLHLHPGGQADLLRRLDEYSQENTLIYTTHLPFLVDLREPGRIHVISETEQGAIVTDDLGRSGPDEKLTLQAALGMKLNQHFLVTPKNLVVEGIDDQWIISELSGLLERAGRTSLDEDVLITAAGGASEAVYLATFMIGQELGVVALFDSDNEGRQQEQRLRTKWITRYKENASTSMLLGDAVGDIGDVAIEDLFSEDYYLAKVQETHKSKMTAAGVKALKLKKGGILCNRVQAACEEAGIQFNKGSVAKKIRHELSAMSDIAQLETMGKDLVDKAERLMTRLNEEFAKM